MEKGIELDPSIKDGIQDYLTEAKSNLK